MKDNNHVVVTQGTPRIENMPKEDFNVLCTSLLCLVEDYYKGDTDKTKENEQTKK